MVQTPIKGIEISVPKATIDLLEAHGLKIPIVYKKYKIVYEKEEVRKKEEPNASKD